MITFSLGMLTRFLSNYDYIGIVFLIAFTNIFMRLLVHWFFGGVFSRVDH